jgi:hypothetical protein
MNRPDKVSICAQYDIASGACTSIEIKLNHDGISRAELIEAVRVAFQPATLLDPYADNTLRNRELGETDVIPVISGRTETNGEHIGIGETTTRLTISFPQN